MKSTYRGQEIEQTPKGWVYTDTGEPTIGNERPCGFCTLENTPEGHDGCLGTLPGVINACCGHGNDSEAYIQYPDKNIIRGKSAMNTILNLLKPKIMSRFLKRDELLEAIEAEFGHGCAVICIERARQKEVRGYDINRDAALYRNGELAQAATAYSLDHKVFKGTKKTLWPWALEMYNPTPDNRKREFEKAGALLAAQIDVEHSNEQENE